MTGEILKQDIINELKKYLPTQRILEQEPMSRHTTFRVGGPAALFLEIATEEELQKVLQLLDQTGENYYLLGNGSNLLVSDMGYDGVILHLAKEFHHVEIREDDTMYCEAGATLAAIARAALAQSLTGFEFAAGIPGTLGGAVVMNAGAYDGEMRQVITSVRLMSPQGEIVEKSCEEMKFGYRHSILKEETYIVLGAALQLRKGQQEDIRLRMEELAAKRRDKQPLEYPSAGSTFKRPEGYFAAKLIQDAGLRGYRHGDAQVSEKHCGFVINRGNAAASDIYALIQEIQTKVWNTFEVKIEPEVIMLGNFTIV